MHGRMVLLVHVESFGLAFGGVQSVHGVGNGHDMSCLVFVARCIVHAAFLVFATLQTDGCKAGIHGETSYAKNAVRQRTSTGWIAYKHESATNVLYNSTLIWSWHGVLINNYYSVLARSSTLDRTEEAAGSHWPDFISCHTPYALSPTTALQDECPYKWMNI